MAAIVPVDANTASSTVADVHSEEENDIHEANAGSEDYLFVEAKHPNTVLQGLNSIRLNNAFCDVTLCCGGQEFPCHRIVLASISSYFQVKTQLPKPVGLSTTVVVIQWRVVHWGPGWQMLPTQMCLATPAKSW